LISCHRKLLFTAVKNCWFTFSLALKYLYTSEEVADSDKHASLPHNGINCHGKKFMRGVPLHQPQI